MPDWVPINFSSGSQEVGISGWVWGVVGGIQNFEAPVILTSWKQEENFISTLTVYKASL